MSIKIILIIASAILASASVLAILGLTVINIPETAISSGDLRTILIAIVAFFIVVELAAAFYFTKFFKEILLTSLVVFIVGAVVTSLVLLYYEPTDATQLIQYEERTDQLKLFTTLPTEFETDAKVDDKRCFAFTNFTDDATLTQEISRYVGAIIDGCVTAVNQNSDFIRTFITNPIQLTVSTFTDILVNIPQIIFIILTTLIAFYVVGFRFAIFTIFALGLQAVFGFWEASMETISLVSISVILALIIAIPLGTLAGLNNSFDKIIKPVLDTMQTMPSFVYLVPFLVLFGIGNVPAIFATLVFALPPAIRFTSLGIRQVAPSAVEAARSLGGTRTQILLKVQIPMALPTIMAGVNQTVLLALAMVVISALVGAGGLGEVILRALGRIESGNALLSGIAIVLIAIFIDRITQAYTKKKKALIGEA